MYVLMLSQACCAHGQRLSLRHEWPACGVGMLFYDFVN